ncbi:thiol-disulfide isomerase/thioredoxin [Deinococcus metalli]|uniref:Thiol-disulfide isomerase/thioredoxin n=1 Tax=Deinococcus metalli TaxID=1141878 RepID=A0A7W8NRJ0_9DEIO|nr:TlpA disulfide reductase family protein [Deinococcus metalli]MBB5379026.1 thiol-disulfide isomerase/thioredoxin [Deinococcus metalli]GHF63253.1 thiol:disulfide interchange protein [Deinococcus metalli]
MITHLDGIVLGPLNLSWSSLTLALGLLTWFGVARFPGAQRAALVTLVVARLWAALPGLDDARPLAEHLLDIVDVRRGSWAWAPGLGAGLVTLWFIQRRPTAGVIRAVALTVLAATVPLVLRPVPAATAATLPSTALPLLAAGAALTPPPLQALPRPGVVNFWATWCPPCRAELPLLASAMAQGEPIALVNVGESGADVQAFLRDHRLDVDSWLGGERFSVPLQVSGFPTTLAVNAAGRIVARHLGPLSGAQLQSLLALAKGAP